MIISVTALTLLVGIALGATIAAPLILIGLIIRDITHGDLW